MKKYHISSRIIHWLMALLLLTMLGLGIYMSDFLPQDAQNKMELYNLHKSLGVMVLIFVIIRIINRLWHPALPMLESLNKFEKLAAHFTHILLYILMIAIPLSGYLMSNSYGFAVHFFSYEMPTIISNNPQLGAVFRELHEFFSYTLIAAISLHILGALKHKFFDKPENDVLKRML